MAGCDNFLSQHEEKMCSGFVNFVNNKIHAALLASQLPSPQQFVYKFISSCTQQSVDSLFLKNMKIDKKIEMSNDVLIVSVM